MFQQVCQCDCASQSMDKRWTDCCYAEVGWRYRRLDRYNGEQVKGEGVHVMGGG